MADSKDKLDAKRPATLQLKEKIRQLIISFKTLQGDPHYIAMGIGIGVFVGVTPTIPFHTALALALAFILKGSKPAAVIGVWFSNPLTIPFFYWGSYKIGMLILGTSIPFNAQYITITELMELGMDVTLAMIAGGIILGIPPGIASYFIARKIFTGIRSRKKKTD